MAYDLGLRWAVNDDDDGCSPGSFVLRADGEDGSRRRIVHVTNDGGIR